MNDRNCHLCFDSFNSSCPLKNAIRNGHLRCFKFAHQLQNKVPCNDETICRDIADKGHLDMLIYAHTNGFLWDKSTCIAAAENGHVDCFRYAIENSCPFNIDECLDAAIRGYSDYEELYAVFFDDVTRRYAKIAEILRKYLRKSN